MRRLVFEERERLSRGRRSAPRAVPLRVLWLACAIAGCAPEPWTAPPVPAAPPLPPPSCIVPATQPWVRTGVHVAAGEVISVSAGGTITAGMTGDDADCRPIHVGPAGTYLYDDAAAVQPFPLAAGALGPAPPWCLIGRIGDSPPFYVGPARSWAADRSGPLWLGINDHDFTDNCGELAATITVSNHLQPVAFQTPVPPDAAPGGAVCGSSVVVFYVDGLRPDVVREMAAMGHLPNIGRIFLEGGLEAGRCYTAFPSDTITSNGTMWTGCFSDRHGIKGQVRFSRRTLHSESYLDPVGPNRAARLLAPQGMDKILHNVKAETIGVLQGAAAEERFRGNRVTGVAPLFEHLRRQGGDWATGALPMMTEMPPILWSRSLVRSLPYFQSQDAWNTIDDANTHFALFDLLDRQSPVTIIWLPETDSVSHKCGRGQFGLTRRTIARADLMIGSVVEQLRALGRLECTYLFLVSDHGHHGGRDSHLSQFDLANELFYKPREVTPEGCWSGGGLGLSVRQHRFWNRHKEDSSRSFVFIDGDSDGAARVFLPRGHFHSGQWMGPHRPGDLLEYRVAAHLPPVNLIETLTAVRAAHGNGYVEPPVDLVLVKLDEASMLIATGDRGYAVIDRQFDPYRGWLYRYTPVESICAAGDGQIAWSPAIGAACDPLGLTEVLAPPAFDDYYDEQTWLNLTAGTRYPDSVVALTRHMLWQENLRYRECEFAPDLVVTARPGWYFGTYATPGTTHGYPLADAMQATMFVAGPNIRRGARMDAPCRLVDLTPTILEMTGTPYVASELDGRPLRVIYEDGMVATRSPTVVAAGSPDVVVAESPAVVAAESPAVVAAGSPDVVVAGSPDPATHTTEGLPPDMAEQPERDLRSPARRGQETRAELGARADLGARLATQTRAELGAARPVYWHEVDLGAWHRLSYQTLPKYPHLPLTVNDPNSRLDLNNMAYNAAALTEINVIRLFDDVLSPLGDDSRAPLLPRMERADLRMRTSARPWVAELPGVIKLPLLTIGDYSQTSAGNMRRLDAGVNWLQARSRSIDRKLATPWGRAALPGTPLVHGAIDGVQAGGWELYRFSQRVAVQVLDEMLINRTEDSLDRLINVPRRQPSEIVRTPAVWQDAE